MKDIKIIDATPEDAGMIAEALLEAVGENLVAHLAGDKTRADVAGIFTRLARRDDTQYSYRNSRIAVMPDGQKAGVCVSYDGSLLKTLRRPFFQEANRVLGWNMSEEEVESLPGETSEEEFYLDTIATRPEYRGRGVASALIMDAKKKADAAGRPLGLLVADDNPRARRLYDTLGFLPVARRPFAGELMTNLRLPSKLSEG